MKIAIVHDWFAEYAGSERCVESFNNLYSDADVFALVDLLDDEERDIILKGKTIHTSFIQKLPFSKTKHRYYLGLFPAAIEKFNLKKYDLVITSSHAVAKGVLTNQNQLHICYCHTPIRYAWELRDEYLKESGLDSGLQSFFVNKVLDYLQKWDYKTSGRPDHFIANSDHVAKRIKKYYNRNSTVIYPPVDIDNFTIDSNKEDFYLTASRLVPYKRIDLIVEAFNSMPDKKLVVIGKGPDLRKIKLLAKKNIQILGYQPSEVLNEYMQKAKAFVFAAHEDFGIIVIEAMSCGTPVIAWNYGGTAETVINGRTGIHFMHQTKESIIEAVNKFETAIDSFNPHVIRKHTEQFSRNYFEENISTFIKEKAENFFRNHSSSSESK
jgi:glycosyltransferase involved in cell wall biosynthesis